MLPNESVIWSYLITKFPSINHFKPFSVFPLLRVSDLKKINGIGLLQVECASDSVKLGSCFSSFYHCNCRFNDWTKAQSYENYQNKFPQSQNHLAKPSLLISRVTTRILWWKLKEKKNHLRCICSHHNSAKVNQKPHFISDTN